MTDDPARVITPEVAAWVTRRSERADPFGERGLALACSSRGLPLLESVVQWERRLRAMGPSPDPGTSYLVSLPDRAFGTAAALADFHAWDGRALSESGDPLVIVGRRTAGGPLFMDAAGRLHGGDGRPALLAEHPAVHLARWCLFDRSAQRGSLHIALAGRGLAGALAGALGLPLAGAASDALARCWGDGALAVIEGELEDPRHDVTHAFAAPERAAELLRACQAAGAAGRLVLDGARTEAAGPAPAPPAPPYRVWIARSDPAGRGGWIGPDESVDPVAVEESVVAGGELAAEGRWPDRVRIVRAGPASIEGLSESGAARLAAFSGRRDPERTADQDALRRLLERLGLPVWAAVLELERSFGGLAVPWPAGPRSLTLGAFEILSSPEDAADHEEAASASGELCVEPAWPHVFHGETRLVPAGAHVQQTLYLDERGGVFCHDHRLDEVMRLGDTPLVALERRLLGMDIARRAPVGAGHRLRGAAAAAEGCASELGLSLFEGASDGQATWWQDDRDRTWMVRGACAATFDLTTLDAETAARARVWLRSRSAEAG